MEAMFNFIPAPIALVLMFIGFAALAVGAIRMGYKQLVKDLAYDLVCKAEDSIMGSGRICAALDTEIITGRKLH